MDYSESLKSKEWKKKRKKVLKRDNRECQRCGVNKHIASETLGLVFTYAELKKNGKIKFIDDSKLKTNLVKIKFYGFSFICKTILSKRKLNKNDKFIIIVNYLFNKAEEPFNGSTEKCEVNSISVKKKKKKKKRIKLISEMVEHFGFKKKKWKIDNDGFYFIREDKFKEYTKNKFFLQVHHKCYRKNYKPWEYKKKELVTLCNVCHKIVHDSQFIPVYDDMGGIVKRK